MHRPARPQDLPPPHRMKHLPRDERGFVVPWFVAWMDEAGEPCPPGKGTPDFRVIRPGGITMAYAQRLCWLCGQPMLPKIPRVFTIGSMCLVNRISAEPPAHWPCANYATKVCPFLTKPRMVRNKKAMPEDASDPGGIMLERNPGVAVLYSTLACRRIDDGSGRSLFQLGAPESLEFKCEGRDATLPELAESIRTGLPILRQLAEEEGPEAMAAFRLAVAGAFDLVPGLAELVQEQAA